MTCSPGMCWQISSEISTPTSLADVPHPEALFGSAIITPTFATLAHSASRQDWSWEQVVFLYIVSILRCANMCEIKIYLVLLLQKIWQRRRNCYLLILQTNAAQFFRTFFCLPVSDLPLRSCSLLVVCIVSPPKIGFLNVFINIWSRLINLESRSFHEPEHPWVVPILC